MVAVATKIIIILFNVMMVDMKWVALTVLMLHVIRMLLTIMRMLTMSTGGRGGYDHVASEGSRPWADDDTCT